MYLELREDTKVGIKTRSLGPSTFVFLHMRESIAMGRGREWGEKATYTGVLAK